LKAANLRGPKKTKQRFKFSFPSLILEALGSNCAKFAAFLMKNVIYCTGTSTDVPVPLSQEQEYKCIPDADPGSRLVIWLSKFV
jgi:hypothetical protein